jgi:hypothetical protein
MSKSKFKIGDNVICIDPDFSGNLNTKDIYTVRAITTSKETGEYFIYIGDDVFDYYLENRFQLFESIEKQNTKLLKKVKEQVNNPDHYQNDKFEVIEVIEAYKLGFNLGNCIKYVLRAGKKDPTKTIQDIEKAIWYLNREIKNIQEKNYE